jgi:hypothetical protein
MHQVNGGFDSHPYSVQHVLAHGFITAHQLQVQGPLYGRQQQGQNAGFVPAQSGFKRHSSGKISMNRTGQLRIPFFNTT